MAQGYRREVRNDRPATGETREQMHERRHNEWRTQYLPSRNKPKHRRAVPPGTVSIYRVHYYDGRRNVYHGIYRDEAQAYRVADDLFMKQPRWGDRHKFEVEHKAAIELNGRFYIVNLDPIKFTEPEPVAVLLGGSNGHDLH